jgi:CRP-like cAMP-binding protein
MSADRLKPTLADLKSIYALYGIPDRKLRSLLPLCRKRVAAKNAVLFLEDEPAHHLYFVLKGCIDMTIHVGKAPSEPPRDVVEAARSPRLTIHRVVTGQSMGWSAIVPPHVYTATAQCVDASLLLELDAEELRRLLDKDARLGYMVVNAMARVMSNRMHDTRNRLIDVLARGEQQAAVALTSS